MTGDTTINAEASCLVMTTEILRSMLYRGSSTTREAQLIVFDEIHYLRWARDVLLMSLSYRSLTAKDAGSSCSRYTPREGLPDAGDHIPACT